MNHMARLSDLSRGRLQQITSDKLNEHKSLDGQTDINQQMTIDFGRRKIPVANNRLHPAQSLDDTVSLVYPPMEYVLTSFTQKKMDPVSRDLTGGSPLSGQIQ